MDNVNDLCNTSILSQSYTQGVKRVVGRCDSNQEEFELPKGFIEAREKTWASLFEKFSQVSDDVELNLRTLNPGEESSSPYSSEYRIPVRKSEAQLRYWIETGNPPYHLNEKEDEEEEVETDRTISISESEASELQTTSSTSMMVDKKLAISMNQLLETGSSGSSVDTATYIRNNGNARKTVDKDPRSTNFTNLENNRVSRSINVKTAKISLNRSMGSSKNMPVEENDPVLNKSISALRSEINNDGNGRSDEEIRREDIEISEQLRLSNLKESEVTFDSKESGIGSLPITNTERDKKTKDCASSDSLNEIVPVRKKNFNRMRKLYTGDNSFFDLISSVVRPVSKNRSLRYSLHPALSSNTPEGIKKRKFRPSLLTLPGSSKAKRKSIGLAAKISRARDKRRRQSVKDSNVSLRNDVLLIEEASTEMEEKARDVCMGEEKEADVLQDKSRANSPVICRKIIKTPKSQSSLNSSSSLSSGDVSKIINENSREVLETSFNNTVKNKARKASDNAKNQTPKNRSGKKNFTNLKLTDSRGSVFTPDENVSSETLETRMKSMIHAKKNLYATDLRSSESAESPSALSPSRKNSLSNANPSSINNLIKKSATPRRSSKRLRNAASDISAKISACGQSNPVIILQDFRSLKNCFGKSDREIYEKWISKQSLNDAMESTTKKSKKLSVNKIPVTKKSKLENKKAPSGSGEKIETRKAIYRNSFSSEDSLPNLKYDDFIVVDRDDCQDIKLTKGSNVTVTFRTANRDTNDSIFVLSSSDEDNIFDKLNSLSGLRSKKKRIKEKVSRENNVGENIINADVVAQHSEISLRPVYKIVSSSSENEENSFKKNSQPTKSRKFKRKLPKRNEGKDSPDSGLTMCSTQDGCSDKSEYPNNGDEKLKKQSQDVNKRLETSKGKQFLNGRGASEAAQSAMNNGSRNRRESRVNVQSKRKICSPIIFNAIINDSFINDEEENFAEIISDNLKIPFKKISPKRGENISIKTIVNDSKKIKESTRNEKIKSPCKIFTTEYADRKNETDVLPSPNYKDRSKTPLKSFGINGLIGCDEEKILNDESYILDDEINFLSRNNAGSYYRIREEENHDESSNINSYKNSKSPSKCEITLRRNLDNNSKEKLFNKEKRSTIIFKTKEYWESDSDNS